MASIVVYFKGFYTFTPQNHTMRKFTLLFAFFAISSCALKQTRQMLASGDYDSAIDNAVYKLRSDKDKKGNQDYVYLLEEAYSKAVERDVREIDAMMKDASPRNLERIFNTYVQLNNRQEKVRPLLPLRKIAQNKEAKFGFSDYSDQIVSSKNALAKYLYDNTKALLATHDKMSYRRAYEDLNYLNQIAPNFKDVPALIRTAHEKGCDYVNVFARNETNVVIPRRLESDLLDFSTYGLNDEWTVYHSTKQQNLKYDFGISLNFRQINVSPEQIREREFTKEKEIKVGRRKKMRGRYPVLDSVGKQVYEDVFKVVKCQVREFTQYKAAQVTAKVEYIDLGSNQLLQAFPISSEFVFQNVYATYRGDKRAIGNDYLPMFNQRPMPFPTNEQMVFDTGEDLKGKLKNVIVRNKIRS